jgi:hypothetical protein
MLKVVTISGICMPGNYRLAIRSGSPMLQIVQSSQTIIKTVARGWESKSVEAQQAEASDSSAKRRPPMTAEQVTRFRERESLRLSRQRVLQQLEVSQNARHRAQLEASLADLEEKLNHLAE